MIMTRRATKKTYTCALCNKRIWKGTIYTREVINRSGVVHWKTYHTECYNENKIMKELRRWV